MAVLATFSASLSSARLQALGATSSSSLCLMIAVPLLNDRPTDVANPAEAQAVKMSEGNRSVVHLRLQGPDSLWCCIGRPNPELQPVRPNSYGVALPTRGSAVPVRARSARRSNCATWVVRITERSAMAKTPAAGKPIVTASSLGLRRYSPALSAAGR
jgi:hypothetical protein